MILRGDPQFTKEAGPDPDVTACGGAGDEQRLAAMLRGEEKLLSLNIMAGGVAHNINNMLLPIMGYLRMARAQISAGSPLAAYLEQIEIAAKRLARLSCNMLAYTGKGGIRRETLDISALIGTLQPLLATIAVKQIELRCLPTQDLPLIEADCNQLRRLVTALVTNAVEAIGEDKGIVTLRTGVSKAGRLPEESVKEEFLPESVLVFLEVADTGCSIPPEIMEKIFDPFFSTKLVGRGLGLAAVQGIVRGHGGAISVTSRPGEGTVFRIFFPAVPRPVQNREEGNLL
jgi:two-component system cell cycle sensor histidine kinase/response regulator CckA